MRGIDVQRWFDRGVYFKPGWKFTVSETLDFYALVVVEFDAPDTDRELALRGYPEMKHMRTAFGCDPSEISGEQELQELFFAFLIALDVHDDREFFRVGPDMDAPFHPHNVARNDDFEATVLGRVLSLGKIRTSGLPS